eukprot:gene31081-6207_t
MKAARADPSICPPLLLAPMENLGDRWFRMALAQTVGGLDEACTEFIRIPNQSDYPERSTRGVTKRYEARELGNIPLGAQIVSANAELLALASDHT